MAEPEVEAAWRAEYERLHATEAFDHDNVFLGDPKAALRWSGDDVEAQRLQKEHTHHYVRWTWLGAVAVLIVGLIGVGLTFLH
jgi:hypothetical protein